MKEFTVNKAAVLEKDLYCGNCGTWIYCPAMNAEVKADDGHVFKEIGEGCLHHDDKGSFLECPDCKCHYYLDE